MREMACHSLMAYVQRLRAAGSRESERHSLRLHARRALLELLLTTSAYAPLYESLAQSRAVKAIKGSATMPLHDYLRESLRRLGLPPPDAIDRDAERDWYGYRWGARRDAAADEGEIVYLVREE